ncbi:MAG TPA: alpha/beta hydrolase [Polyangiaceae bacterium]
MVLTRATVSRTRPCSQGGGGAPRLALGTSDGARRFRAWCRPSRRIPPSFRESRRDAPTWFVEDRTDFTDRLRSVTQPTLLVYGERDLIAPPSVGEFLQTRLPTAKLEVVPGATHELEEEHPDLLASLIEAHLRL